jgi:hypothetical protein
LLAAVLISGIGIGVLARFGDGLYSAVCLFFLPLAFALAAVSVLYDFGNPPPVKIKMPARRTISARDLPARTATR